MLAFWQTFYPKPILLDLGLIKIHWYGLLISASILAGFCLFKFLAKKRGLAESHIYNLSFYLIVFGLIGGRLGHVFFYNWPYFKIHPWEILAVWHGGMAILGGLLAGLITLIIYVKKNNLSFWLVADCLAVVLPLAQAIGRFGNYFNQELFGRPCDYFWCIPINFANRPEGFLFATYFQPLFLYEAVLSIVLFLILLSLFKQSKLKAGRIFFIYLIGYLVIRFFMEFLRLDTDVAWLGLKPVQWICLAVVLSVAGCYLSSCQNKNHQI